MLNLLSQWTETTKSKPTVFSVFQEYFFCVSEIKDILLIVSMSNNLHTVHMYYVCPPLFPCNVNRTNVCEPSVYFYKRHLRQLFVIVGTVITGN